MGPLLLSPLGGPFSEVLLYITGIKVNDGRKSHAPISSSGGGGG